MALSVYLVRFLCGGHNGTSTPVMFLAPVDQYPDLFRIIWFLLSMVTLTLSTLLIPVVACCYGSRVQHDAPSALRGLFFHSRHVARAQRSFLPSRHVAAGGAFSGRLPFVAFFLLGPLSLSLVVFLPSRLVRLAPYSCRSAYRDALLILIPIQNPLLWCCCCRSYRSCSCCLSIVQSFSRHGPPLTSLLDLLVALHLFVAGLGTRGCRGS
jgi:hypothetical protein